jgi:hypothetical protein
LGNEKREMSNVKFLQSVNDFPVVVSLDKKNPSWGMSRFGDGCDLCFVPHDNEGFSLRGNKQKLLYTGRKKSHRFTILSDGAFEYDCILLREPESNIISLRMEGAGKYDFFRQPDFVRDDFLKGSYAVYKKDTLIGEGTGKLCHIHRPKIFDARGFSCWGDLAVVGDELLIIIPESFLSSAKYPVVVDPTVGTTTIGSQSHWDYDPPEPPIQLVFEVGMVANRFLVPETLNGLCTAYMYSNADNYQEAGGRPVLYSDNNNSPLSRKSMNENFADFTVNSSKPAGWRSATFNTNASITSGSYVWFGVYAEWFWEPRFDYGAKCYWEICDGDSIPNMYPVYNVNSFYDYKLSMYFTYTSAQNYVRTLTQGVKLTDTRKFTANYKRDVKQTVRANTVIKSFETIIRKCVMSVQSTMNIKRLPTFYRNVIEQVKINSVNYHFQSFVRKCVESISIHFNLNRIQGFMRTIQENLKSVDSILSPVVFIRNVNDETVIYESRTKTAEYIKLLEIKADMVDDTSHIAEYHREQKDEVQAEGLLFRSVTFFVKIITGTFIRDYIVQRFLKAREELKLKSCITREIILNSKII